MKEKVYRAFIKNPIKILLFTRSGILGNNDITVFKEIIFIENKYRYFNNGR